MRQPECTTLPAQEHALALHLLNYMCMSLTYLDLLVGSDSTEHNLGKVLSGEHPETDATNHVVLLNQSQRVVFPVHEWEGH